MNRKIRIPQLQLDRSSGTPLHRQLRKQLTAAMESGAIAAGSTLPSSRLLSALLGVSRNTVITAYDELVADGLAVAAPGSGIRVRRAGQMPGFHVNRLLRAAHYPIRSVSFSDSDGTPISLSF